MEHLLLHDEPITASDDVCCSVHRCVVCGCVHSQQWSVNAEVQCQQIQKDKQRKEIWGEHECHTALTLHTNVELNDPKKWRLKAVRHQLVQNNMFVF